MDDLFEQLKAAPPVNTITPTTDTMPPPKTPALKKANYQKTVGNDQLLVENSIKPVKVLIERKKFNAIGSMSKTSQSAASATISTKASVKGISNKIEPTVDVMKQKHLQKAKIDQQLTKIRGCFVKLPKRNFFLQRLNIEQSTKLKTLVPNGKATNSFVTNKSKSSKKADSLKRKHTAEPDESFISPKRGRLSPKHENFFIKIKNSSKQKKKAISLNKCVPSPSIAPTKFPRSKLVEAFGKRFFQSHVRIEKAKHPMMVVFESNAKASLELARANRKSKNLSVSFLGQVEIFGESSSDDENDEKDDTASTSRKETPNSLMVTPTRLTKKGNDKEVDDIELHSTEFILGPEEFITSTPTVATKTSSPKRKEKKSYSPLKQDSPMSPRKEALKKANEVLPRGYQPFIDYENDEGGENSVEYIVPIEMPERRLSRKNSIIPNTSRAPENVLEQEEEEQLNENNTIIDNSEVTILPNNDTETVSPTAKRNELSKECPVPNESDKSAYTSANETIDNNFPIQFLEPLTEIQQIVESPTNLHDTDLGEIEEPIVPTVDECIAIVSGDNDVNSSSVPVLPENALATILDDSLERVLPSSVNSNRDDSSSREEITASVLPEIPPNTFDSLFDDGDVFIPEIRFSPERSNQNLVEKSTLSAMQDIMNEQENLEMPEVLLTDQQNIPSTSTILTRTTTSSFNLSEAPTPVPIHIRSSQSVSPKLVDTGKSTFSRIVNSMKNIITQTRSSAD